MAVERDNETLPYETEIRSGTPNSILASLYRQILHDQGIDGAKFLYLMAKYMRVANIPANTVEVASVRGNLKRELMKAVMSWKTFIKGIMVLNIRRFDITISLHHRNGVITNHSKSITLDVDMPDDKGDEA